MKEFRLFRWFKELLGVREPEQQALAPAPKAAVQPPLSESLVELNAAMHTLDSEMLRLAQARQSLGVALESLKEQKTSSDGDTSMFGRVDSTRLN